MGKPRRIEQLAEYYLRAACVLIYPRALAGYADVQTAAIELGR
jgi:hypothetical protein